MYILLGSGRLYCSSTLANPRAARVRPVVVPSVIAEALSSRCSNAAGPSARSSSATADGLVKVTAPTARRCTQSWQAGTSERAGLCGIGLDLRDDGARGIEPFAKRRQRTGPGGKQNHRARLELRTQQCDQPFRGLFLRHGCNQPPALLSACAVRAPTAAMFK